MNILFKVFNMFVYYIIENIIKNLILIHKRYSILDRESEKQTGVLVY